MASGRPVLRRAWYLAFACSAASSRPSLRSILERSGTPSAILLRSFSASPEMHRACRQKVPSVGRRPGLPRTMALAALAPTDAPSGIRWMLKSSPK